MGVNSVANIRAIIVVVITLFIALRSFYLYIRVRSARLFILGFAMVMIALTTTADTIGDNITFHLNSYWFNYFGQTCSYLFILLSLLMSSEKSLRNLMRWQIAISAMLLILLMIGPALPSTFPNIGTARAILSSGRGVIPFIIFFYYVYAFMSKETRFSFLMGAAFLLLSFCYLIIAPRYVFPHMDLLQVAGDIVRICGFTMLLAALTL